MWGCFYEDCERKEKTQREKECPGLLYTGSGGGGYLDWVKGIPKLNKEDRIKVHPFKYTRCRWDEIKIKAPSPDWSGKGGKGG